MCYADFRTSLSFLSKIDWDGVSQDMNFNEIHEIICGLSVRGLNSEISNCDQEINQEDVFGYTPLWHACKFGQDEIVRALLSDGANPDLGRRTLPLVAAIQSKSYSCVKLLFEYGAKAPTRILDANHPDYQEGPYVEGVAESAEEDQMLVIDRLMIERGFRWNCQYGRLFTALMYCCMAVTPDKSGIRSFRQGRLKLLLETSIDLELRDSRGRTAMTHAVENSCTMAFDSLVQAGARLDVTRVEGWTVLHSVVLYTKSLSLIKALAKALSRGKLNMVDLDTRDQYGFTAYELLQRRKNPRWSQLVSEFDFPYLPPRYRWIYDEGQDQESDVIEGLETLFRQLREARGVKPDIRQPDSTDIGISIPGAWPEVVPYR